MKRFYQITLLAVAMVMMTTAAYAVPARPNMWRKIKLNDGTECFAMLRGDENYSYLADREGNGYRNLGNGTYDDGLRACEKHKAARQNGKARPRSL